MRCRICNNFEGNKEYEVREMMFGFKDVFRYFQCSACHCLQIESFPKDIEKYYPKRYYSYQPIITKNLFKKLLVRERNRYALLGKGLLGGLLDAKFPNGILSSLRNGLVHKESRILDVGCGAGGLVHTLYDSGIKNVLGIDPYNANDVVFDNGLRVLKKEIHSVEGGWDLIMFHHSFEHVPNPLETLKAVFGLLNPNSCCLIRIPVIPSYVWDKYGINWVSLDAPRHFFIYSVESIKILASKAGLRLEKVVYDSTSFQFWGSEQYQRDITLHDARSYAVNPNQSVFSKNEINAFEKRSNELNNKSYGDQAAFYLKKDL